MSQNWRWKIAYCTRQQTNNNTYTGAKSKQILLLKSGARQLNRTYSANTIGCILHMLLPRIMQYPERICNTTTHLCTQCMHKPETSSAQFGTSEGLCGTLLQGFLNMFQVGLIYFSLELFISH